MNELTRWVIGGLAAAIVGAYTFTYNLNSRTEDRIFSRLDMLDAKIERILERTSR